MPRLVIQLDSYCIIILFFFFFWEGQLPLILVMQSVEDERIQRQRLRDLAVFERLDGDPRKSSPALAVKKVCKVC